MKLDTIAEKEKKKTEFRAEKPRDYTVAMVTDPHCGSRVALGGLDHKDAFRPIRERLTNIWLEAVSRHKAPDVLLVLGDCVDGQNRKGNGTGTWTNDVIEQCEESIKYLDMWGAKKIIIARGSDYHVDIGGSGMPAEEFIGRELGAVEDTTLPGQRSAFEWYLTINGFTIHAAHYIAIARAWAYRSTPVARLMLAAKLADALRHEMPKYKTRMVARGHGHFFTFLQYSRMSGVTLPGFKVRDEFALKRNSLEYVPEIGYAIMTISKDREMDLKHSVWCCEHVQKPNHVILGRKA